jgi:RimJ/RimL family protein N-acetyltransferase
VSSERDRPIEPRSSAASEINAARSSVPAPTDGGEEIRLTDGTRLIIRPIRPADAPLLAAAFAELSPESRYRRFFTPMKEVDAEHLAYLTDVDHHDHEALVAIHMSSGSCAGVARFVRVAPEVAEPAVVVGDRWQGLGLGTKLLEELADRARTEGVTRFAGVVLADNQDAIRLLERLGSIPPASGPELNFEIDLLDDERAHPTLRELVRALAEGLLAPARALAGREPHEADGDT